MIKNCGCGIKGTKFLCNKNDWQNRQRLKVIYYKNTLPIETTYTYYKNHLLKNVTYPEFAGANTTSYTYDGNGNMTQKTDAKNQTITYAYDGNNCLIKKVYMFLQIFVVFSFLPSIKNKYIDSKNTPIHINESAKLNKGQPII